MKWPRWWQAEDAKMRGNGRWIVEPAGLGVGWFLSLARAAVISCSVVVHWVGDARFWVSKWFDLDGDEELRKKGERVR